MGEAKTLVVFQTHTFDRQLRFVFKQIVRSLPAHYDAVVLVHLPPGAPLPPLIGTVPHMIVRTPEIRVPEYGLKSGLDQPDWTLWNGGHTDLPFLRLAHDQPGYAYYWVVEYDVRYSGRWNRLFGAFEDSDADIIATNLRTAATEPGWHFWHTLTTPGAMQSLADADRICSFMPIYRASARLVQAVDRCYRSGWSGHSEAIWPTIARHAGLKIEDLGGHGEFVRPANRGRYYESTPGTWNLAPGTFVYKPIKHVRYRRNMLWHPMKPIGPTIREDLQRIKGKCSRIVKQARTLLEGHPRSANAPTPKNV